MDRCRVTTWLRSAALLPAFSQPALAAQKGTLTIWINKDKGYNGLRKVADEFARASGMRVKVEHFDNAVGNFEDAMKAGKGPDIFTTALKDINAASKAPREALDMAAAAIRGTPVKLASVRR